MAISQDSTVGSSYVLEMLFLLHVSTNWPERLKGTYSIWQKSSSNMSWKTKKEMHLQGSLVAGRFISLPPLDQAKFLTCCSYYMYLRTDQRDWKELTLFDINHHRKCPEKQKRKCTCRAVWSAADLSLFNRWIMLSFGYVVRLDVSFILNGGDRKRSLRQGFVHVEQ